MSGCPVGRRHSCRHSCLAVCHTNVLNHFEARRLPFYLTFASVVAVLCSISASNCLIGAAVAALLVCHFRSGDALRFPPVKLPLGLFTGGKRSALSTGETAARPVLSGDTH